MRNKMLIGLSVAALALLWRDLYVMLVQMPDEAMQGAIYRIIYFHVPAAWIALLCSVGALITSSLFLIKRNFNYDAMAVSITEVGLVFGAVNLLTGMIWARRIWGIWWTWDARLTSMLVLWLLYAGYLMLRKSIDDPTQRAKAAAVMSILAFIDMPIVVFSIKWWRTQHPQPVFWDKGYIEPAMKYMTYWNLLALAMVATVFLVVRTRQERTMRELESLRRSAHSTWRESDVPVSVS